MHVNPRFTGTPVPIFGRDIGGGRSFKVEGQEWGLRAVPQWGPGAPGGGSLQPQKLKTLSVKCYFVTVLGMTQRYLHSLPASVQCEMEEKSIWRQKSGRTSNNAGHNK